MVQRSICLTLDEFSNDCFLYKNVTGTKQLLDIALVVHIAFKISDVYPYG